MSGYFKVVCVDNFARETVADRLIVDRLTKETAERVAEEKNRQEGEHSPNFYRVYPQDRALWRGMEELI